MTLGLKTAMKEETRSKVWPSGNKDGRQEQSIWGPVGQRVYEERQQRYDLMCSDEEGKEQLGKEPWTKEEQDVHKDLMEGRLSHRDQGANRKLGWAAGRVWNKGVHYEWTDLGREAEWRNKQGGKVTEGREHGQSIGEPRIKAMDGSAKASGTSDKYQDLVGTMFRQGRIGQILKPTTWGEWGLPKDPGSDRLRM